VNPHSKGVKHLAPGSSRLKLDGFALVADMAFIQQSLLTNHAALFEIALVEINASLAKLCSDYSSMVAYSHGEANPLSPVQECT
jgi:hypothetical protein